MSSLKVDALRSGLMALMPSDVPAQLQRPTTMEMLQLGGAMKMVLDTQCFSMFFMGVFVGVMCMFGPLEFGVGNSMQVCNCQILHDLQLHSFP